MESGTETPPEVLLVNGFAKVTKNPILERTRPDAIIGIRGHQDRRNRMPHFDEASVKLESVHRGHMDVGDQASGFDKARGREEIGSRRESLDAMTERPHEPFHRFAKERIVFDDRNQ